MIRNASDIPRWVIALFVAINQGLTNQLGSYEPLGSYELTQSTDSCGGAWSCNTLVSPRVMPGRLTCTAPMKGMGELVGIQYRGRASWKTVKVPRSQLESSSYPPTLSPKRGGAREGWLAHKYNQSFILISISSYDDCYITVIVIIIILLIISLFSLILIIIIIMVVVISYQAALVMQRMLR